MDIVIAILARNREEAVLNCPRCGGVQVPSGPWYIGGQGYITFADCLCGYTEQLKQADKQVKRRLT